MKALSGVLVGLAGWAFVFDAYRQRDPGQPAAAWVRRGVNADNWSWWVPALAAASFVLVAAVSLAARDWWGLAAVVPVAGFARIALLRKKGLSTRGR